MHLIKDENGNFVYHGHEHTHADEAVHSHSHSHGEVEEHEHSNEDAYSDENSRNKTLALLRYMLDHNVHHAEELAQMAISLGEDKAVADAILEAVADFRKSNEKLANVVKIMEEKSEL